MRRQPNVLIAVIRKGGWRLLDNVLIIHRLNTCVTSVSQTKRLGGLYFHLLLQRGDLLNSQTPHM